MWKTTTIRKMKQHNKTQQLLQTEARILNGIGGADKTHLIKVSLDVLFYLLLQYDAQDCNNKVKQTQLESINKDYS